MKIILSANPPAARAVTLIELLATMVLGIVLISLILGGVQKVRSSAKAAECTSRMRNLGVAAQSFIGDNNGLLPYRVLDASDPQRGEARTWMKHLGMYSGVDGRFVGNDPPTDILLCPDDPSRSPRQLRTYRYNHARPAPPHRLGEIASPASHAMLFCLAYTGSYLPDIWRYDTAIWGKHYDTLYPPGSGSAYVRPHFEERAVNVLYFDGHVAASPYPLPEAAYQYDLKSDGN